MAADSQRILTGVKHIYFTPWTGTGGTTAPSSTDRYELTNIIADSVAISQDDPETSTIDSETRDEPIIESIKNGNYTVTMDSADINFDILETCLGFSKIGSTTTLAAAAPAAYSKKFVMVEILFDDTALVLPRILLTSKIDASSLKTNVAKGTLSGTAYSAAVTVGSETTAVDTPFFVTTVSSGTIQSFSVAMISS